MPKKNCKSQQAQAQSVLGKRGFRSGLQDDDDMAKSQDPDFVPAKEKCVTKSDTDSLDYRGAFSLYVATVPATQPNEQYDDEEREELTGSDLLNAVMLDTESSNQINAQPAKKVRLLKALPAFTGAGRTTTYKKKKVLAEAAKGCQRIDAYFGACLRKPSIESHVESQNTIGMNGTLRDDEMLVRPSESDSIEDTIPMPGSPAQPASEAAETPEEIPIEELLDVTADDEINNSCPDTAELVNQLLHDAKWHKSYGATF
ncbi:hypothetical protein H0H92_011203 [Tricholoma furcatifolium]|nr:hypothetical protein H0H92_011203 [Tricholoma furcatifolium]